MASTQRPAQPLSLPAIHARWAAALALPPSAQISAIRRLVRAVTKDHHPALRSLPLAALCPLYLDLALAYAFVGEYYLASQVFKEAVDNDATSAVGWFGVGLAQAELGEWRNARRSWKLCLQCFESVGGQQEVIRYGLFQPQDEAAQMLDLVLDSGQWTLERTRVDFNYRVALGEKGSKKLGVAPRPAGQKRPGLNGILAGMRFGPGWDASLQSLDSPLLLQHSSFHAAEHGKRTAFLTGNPPTTAQTPPSSRTSHPGASLPPRISSHKPPPALPPTPKTPTPSLADKGSFNDHRPSMEKDPFTSSPEKDILDPFATPPQTLTTRPHDEQHTRFSRQSTLFTPEDQYFYDHSDDEDDDGSLDTATAIDDTIASWSGFGQTQEEQNLEDQNEDEKQEQEEEEAEEAEEAENIANGTHEQTIHTPSADDGGEILQPRVFEGFGPPSQERRRRWDSGLVRQCDKFPGNGSTFSSSSRRR